MNKSIFALLAGGAMLTACQDGDIPSTYSLDNKVEFALKMDDGKIKSAIIVEKDTIIPWSTLGLQTTKESFGSDMEFEKSSKQKRVYKEYKQTKGKCSDVIYSANQREYTFENENDNEITILCQVSENGVAFTYKILGEDSVEITKEYTEFAMKQGTKQYTMPMSTVHTGFAGTNPSYEEHYQMGITPGTKSFEEQGWCWPALFEAPNNCWILISESGNYGQYVGTHLAEEVKNNVFTVGFPQVGEIDSLVPTSATVAPGTLLPWKTIVIGDLATITENTMAQNVVEPRYEAKYEYPTGVASWSWVVKKDGSANYPISMQYIDMAEKLGFKYCLIDGWWDRLIGREKMREVVAYANSKNVGIILWYNSNGKWNDAPQTPRDRMYPAENRREEMKWLQEIGVKGIKVDFFGGDKQQMMQFYNDLFTDANDFGIGVNVHGATLPRGWDIMYPNFMTAEAVMGMEFCTFFQHNEYLRPSHSCMIPFARNTVAPADFTPTILNPYLGESGKDGVKRVTTAAFELASPIIMYSGVQHLGLTPENLSEFPNFVWDYFKVLPACWDETKFISGFPGQYVVFSRRSGDRWFIAGINGSGKEMQVTIVPSMLPKGTYKLIEDSYSPNQVICTPIEVDGQNSITVTMQVNGGFVIY